MHRKAVSLLLQFAFLLLLLVPPAFSNEISDLKDEVTHLHQQNEILQQQFKQQRQLTQKLLKKVEALERKAARAPAPTPVPALPVQKTAGGDYLQHMVDQILDKDASSALPKIQIRGFADAGMTAKTVGSEFKNSFTAGEFDLYITSKLSDNVGALLEADFHANSDTNSTGFGLQRINIWYTLSNLLKIKLGRIHTPLGYWNQAFHHGNWLQTTINRPEIYLFERDSGGFLPVHGVGIEFSGALELPPGDLSYKLDVLNGRGKTVSTVQHVTDENDSKAVNFLLNFSPEAWEGLSLGGNVYVDRIPSSPPTATRTSRIDELILGAHVVYLHDPVEFITEFFNIHHDDKTSGMDFDTLGMYAQGSYRLNEKLKPYYRFDLINVATSEPFFTGSRRLTDRSVHTLGLRWDLSNWNALKFEYGMRDNKSTDDEHSFSVNSSWAF